MATRLTDLTAFTGTAIDDLDEFWIDDYNSLTATMTSANPGVVTVTGHGLVANNIVVFTTTGALPNNVTPSTNYYVIASGLTTDDFQISATAGGVAIDMTSGTQSGVHTCTYYVSRKMSGADLKTLLGNVGYSETFTPGTVAVANTITHSLDSTDIIIELWDDTSGEQLFADLDNRTANSVDVTFGVNPAGDVRIVVLANGGTIATDSRPYKVYTAIVTQSSTNAPVLTILENTFTEVPTSSYTSVGDYAINFASTTLTANKTAVFANNTIEYNKRLLGKWGNTTKVILRSQNAGSYADDIFSNTSVEIRLYD